MPKGRGRGRGGGAAAAGRSGASNMSKEMREDLGLATPAKEPVTIATSPTTTIPAPPPPPPAVETNESGSRKPKASKKRKPVPPSFLPDTPVTSRTNSVSAEPASRRPSDESMHEDSAANALGTS